MRLVVDSKIPYIREALATLTADVAYIEGSEITAADVRSADALIVRTRTACDECLLGGSSVRFIATATIGYDHLDTDYLQRAGIAWTNCPGCNAGSVAQYVRSVFILLLRDGMISRGDMVGIVGCGHVGSRVLAVAREMGFNTMVCDPPLNAPHTLGDIAAACDIVTFHVPLTHDGPHATYHLADNRFFDSLRHRPVVINTSRGAVVDNEELLTALNDGRVRQAVIDTWEGEPLINLDLLRRVYIGTPHIAGYSADGKVNADNMVLDALCRFFNIDSVPRVTAPQLQLSAPLPPYGTDDYYLSLYNPMDDSLRLKNDPAAFERLRGSYPLRRERA